MSGKTGGVSVEAVTELARSSKVATKLRMRHHIVDADTVQREPENK